MEQHLFQYKNSTINYYRFGHGPKTALCFHGYGENGKAFSFLTKYLENQYTFYAIDLPFHGETIWDEGLNLTTCDLQQITNGIFEKHENDKPQTTNHKLTLIGFSLGARITLQLYQAMPENVEKMILMAPDGLKVNFWYWLATQNRIGSRVFKFTMRHPAWFLTLLKMLNELKLVNTSIFKFVNYYIGDEQVRKELYERWMTLRKIKPGIKMVKQLIPLQPTSTKLLYGRYDKIILPARGEKFRKGIEAYCDLITIASGHQLLHEKHAGEIIKSLES